MTYKELYEKAASMLDRGEITLGDFNKMVKPLNVEIHHEPHWISVTKDTPKEAGTYMCTCYDAGRRIVTLAKWQPRTKTWNLTGARAYWKVIAWCNLPEPYKGVTT